VSAPLRVLVVDDEAPARAALCHLLGRDAEIQVVGVCGDGSAALEALAASAPEIVFLDVRMPGLDGFEVLRAAGACPARVVFVTAHAERAPEAFDVEAIDYVLKPFDDERFARALSRAKAAVRADRTRAGDGGGVAGPRWLERLTVPTVDGVRVLEAGEIDWIEAQDYCVEVHAGGRGYLLRRSLRELEARLDPARFARVHRSAIVNVARVQHLATAGHGERALRLRDGTQLKLSRHFRGGLLGILGGGG
jgi:two-component system LytT family response regulator